MMTHENISSVLYRTRMRGSKIVWYILEANMARAWTACGGGGHNSLVFFSLFRSRNSIYIEAYLSFLLKTRQLLCSAFFLNWRILLSSFSYMPLPSRIHLCKKIHRFAPPPVLYKSRLLLFSFLLLTHVRKMSAPLKNVLFTLQES